MVLRLIKAGHRLVVRLALGEDGPGQLAMFSPRSKPPPQHADVARGRGGLVLVASKENPQVRRWQRTDRQGAMFMPPAHEKTLRGLYRHHMRYGNTRPQGMSRKQVEQRHIVELREHGYIEVKTNPAEYTAAFSVRLTKRGRAYVRKLFETQTKRSADAQGALFKAWLEEGIVTRFYLRKAGAPPMAGGGRANPQSRGLQLVQSKRNPRVRRWERVGEEPGKAPQRGRGGQDGGQRVRFHHPDTGEEMTGSIRASGKKGATVVDDNGRAHKVPHGDYVNHHDTPDKPEAGPVGAQGAESGKGQVGAQQESGAEAKPEPRDWRQEKPGLSRYPQKGVPDDDVEHGGDDVNWALRWRHPKTGAVQLAYEESFLKARAAQKFRKMATFGGALPTFRTATAEHMELGPATERGVLAAMAAVVDHTCMRAGGRAGDTFGVTTLRKEHAKVQGDRVTFRYTGKAGVPQVKTITHPQVAAAVKHMLTLPGDRLFQVDHPDGPRPVTASKLRSYVQEHTGGGSTKDFRTFHATRWFSEAVDKLGPPESKADGEAKIQKAATQVAEILGHKRARPHNQQVEHATPDKALAKKHGGKVVTRQGRTVVAFKTAAERKAYEAGTTGATRLGKDDRVEVSPTWELETTTSLDNYIDPTVVQAYRQGLTLSGGTLRKARTGIGVSGMSEAERRFTDYLDQVKKADPFGTSHIPEGAEQ